MERRGGSRKGSGRKPITLSDKEKASLIKAARKIAKETGQTVADILLALIYDTKYKKYQVAALKVYFDAIIAKDRHEKVDVDIKDNRVAVYLPEIRQPDVREVPSA